MKKLLFTLLCLSVCAAMAAEDLKPFPEAKPGFKRMVFRLPVVENEADRMVEVLVGQTLTVDCNRSSFVGALEKHVVEGWGYTYYSLAPVGPPVSTMMACPEEESKVEAFVIVRGDGFRQRYNSKLPVVVYVPEAFDVRYRIWTAGGDIGRAGIE